MKIFFKGNDPFEMGLFESRNAQPLPSQAEIAKAINARGKERQVSYQCPFCSHRKWDVAGVVVNQLERQEGAAENCRCFVPTALLICGRCAYTAQFSLVSLGLLSEWR